MARIELRPDGPHSDNYTAEVARALAESVRVLNYATGSHAERGLTCPQTVYDVTGALSAGVAGLGQLLDQTAAFLHRQAEAGTLADSRSEHGHYWSAPMTARSAARHLADARTAAADLAAALSAAQTFASGLYMPDSDGLDDGAEGCGSEFIDGSWTFCGCPECDDREAAERDRDAELGVTGVVGEER